MDKEICDKLICEYMGKIYGFAVTKTSTVDKAEELASRITLEVYSSLLRCHGADNIAAYIYRIAQNVYARFTDENAKSRHSDIDGLGIADDDDFTERIMESETYAKLRVEIAYLSKIRREILMLHYYNDMKLADIAKRMDIPLGTVKWHISGAKNELKERMDIMRNIGKLGLEPIELCNMGHCGSPGKKGDTADFLAKRITQNIAYAAYHKPRSINEIADELGISPVFVADEVETLEEYGFMDKVGQDKYRTNIAIYVPKAEIENKRHIILCDYAKKVRDIYIPKVIDALMNYDMSEVYVPNGDTNLWLWSGITAALGFSEKLCPGIYADAMKFSVPRKDGGNFLAGAHVKTDVKLDFDARKYSCCGDMNRWSEKYPVYSWQLVTEYSGKKIGWRDNLTSDYDYLYEFICGKIEKTPEDIDKYKRLCDKCYITADDKVNVICIKDEMKNNITQSKLFKAMPDGGDEMHKLALSLADEWYELDKELFAEHIYPIRKEFSKLALASNEVRMRVIELLLADGTLKLPSKEAAAGLTTLMFTDRLPE